MSPLRIVFAGTPEFAVPALDALHAAGHASSPSTPSLTGRRVAAAS